MSHAEFKKCRRHMPIIYMSVSYVCICIREGGGLHPCLIEN